MTHTWKNSCTVFTWSVKKSFIHSSRSCNCFCVLKVITWDKTNFYFSYLVHPFSSLIQEGHILIHWRGNREGEDKVLCLSFSRVWKKNNRNLEPEDLRTQISCYNRSKEKNPEATQVKIYSNQCTMGPRTFLWQGVRILSSYSVFLHFYCAYLLRSGSCTAFAVQGPMGDSVGGDRGREPGRWTSTEEHEQWSTTSVLLSQYLLVVISVFPWQICHGVLVVVGRFLLVFKKDAMPWLQSKHLMMASHLFHV